MSASRCRIHLCRQGSCRSMWRGAAACPARPLGAPSGHPFPARSCWLTRPAACAPVGQGSKRSLSSQLCSDTSSCWHRAGSVRECMRIRARADALALNASVNLRWHRVSGCAHQQAGNIGIDEQVGGVGVATQVNLDVRQHVGLQGVTAISERRRSPSRVCVDLQHVSLASAAATFAFPQLGRATVSTLLHVVPQLRSSGGWPGDAGTLAYRVKSKNSEKTGSNEHLVLDGRLGGERVENGCQESVSVLWLGAHQLPRILWQG